MTISEHIAHNHNAFLCLKKHTALYLFFSPLVFIVSNCQNIVRQSQNTCMYIYMPACVWHILTIKRPHSVLLFGFFHKLITSQQQGKCDSSLIQTVSAAVVNIRVSESMKDHKQRVWTGSSWFMSRAGKQQNFVDLCTLQTQKRTNVKHMSAAWSVDDSIQNVKKKHLWSRSFCFFSLPLKFPQLLSASAHVGSCFLCRFEIFCHCSASIAHLKQQQNLQKTTWHSLLQIMEKGCEHTYMQRFFHWTYDSTVKNGLANVKAGLKDGGWPLNCHWSEKATV